MNNMKKLLATIFLFLATAVCAEPLTLIVPHPPGGSPDVYARLVAKYLSDQLARDVIVMNKPAAAGRIAVDQAAHSTSGNELLLASTGPFLFNKVIYRNLNTDFEYFDVIAPVARIPATFAVSNASGATSIKDIKALSQQRTVNCSGSSASTLFAGKYMFNQLGITNVTWIPFKGAAEMNTQLAAGNIDCGFDTIMPAQTLHDAGKYKILAIGSNNKWASLPEAMLFKDIIPGMTFYNWYGFAFPKSMSDVDKNKIVVILGKINQDPEYREGVERMSFERVDNPTRGLSWVKSQYQHYDAIRQKLNIEKVD